MNNLLIDFLRLRRAIGAFGFFLLPLLYVASGYTVQASISHYAYTPARDLLTGVLWAIGVMLGVYRGYDEGDRACSLVAGLAIVGVALMPIDGPWRTGHYWAATSFFLSSAALTWRFSFGGYMPLTFKTLSVVMVLFLALSVASLPLIITETVAIAAFGIAWLLKGKIIEVSLWKGVIAP